MARESESGLPIEPVYGPGDLEGWDPAAKLGEPGSYPFTRGVYPSMYTGRPWTMRQYAGFGTAAESNARYRQLIAHGTTGLSVAFDLPTQMGHDSDAPIAHGEVGKVGVAIDSIEDMRLLFKDIPLDKVSTSMTINAPGSVLLLLYQLVAEEQGVPGDKLNGTIPISGAKNAALPLMIAALLTEDTLILDNVPRLADVAQLQRILGNHGLDIMSAGKRPGDRE